MDIDTFLTLFYVIIDDWYQGEMSKDEAASRPALKMSDSEVLTIAVAGQWRAGVPWRSERGVVRYMQSYGRGWFPQMLGRSAFNERVRCLWAALVHLHQYLAELLAGEEDVYECVDCVPLSACSRAQSRKREHWLWGQLHRLGRQSWWLVLW